MSVPGLPRPEMLDEPPPRFFGGKSLWPSSAFSPSTLLPYHHPARSSSFSLLNSSPVSLFQDIQRAPMKMHVCDPPSPFDKVSFELQYLYNDHVCPMHGSSTEEEGFPSKTGRSHVPLPGRRVHTSRTEPRETDGNSVANRSERALAPIGRDKISSRQENQGLRQRNTKTTRYIECGPAIFSQLLQDIPSPPHSGPMFAREFACRRVRSGVYKMVAHPLKSMWLSV